MRGGAHEHLARLSRGLQAGRGVDHLPGDEQLPRGSDAGRSLTRLDPHADLERLVETERLLEPVHPVADREAGADGSHRVVLADVGKAEHRHHGVADELLGVAAERAQLLARRIEEPSEDLASSLGIQRCARPVESTRSANRTVTIFRSSVPSVVATRACRSWDRSGRHRAGGGRRNRTACRSA